MPEPLNLYTLGDSNGESPNGWPDATCRYAASLGWKLNLVNDSLGGRAIGFQKFGPESNALNIAGASVAAAREKLGVINLAVIGLGTNDAQRMWVEQGRSVEEILGNLFRLLAIVRQGLGQGTRLFVLSPPPLGAIMEDGAPVIPLPQGAEQQKRRGTIPRLREIVAGMPARTAGAGAVFISAYDHLSPTRDSTVGPDGVHLTPEGQARMGRLVFESILADLNP